MLYRKRTWTLLELRTGVGMTCKAFMGFQWLYTNFPALQQRAWSPFLISAPEVSCIKSRSSSDLLDHSVRPCLSVQT